MSMIPEPVFDEEPGLIDFYHTAWKLAANNIIKQKGAPQSPYMNEGINSGKIWIWDTCFMVLFCKYAPGLYPGIQSLDNFYLPMLNNITSPLKIHHPDNPPLFSWVEYEHGLFTGDDDRFRRLILGQEYLQKHFAYFENLKRGEHPPYSGSAIALEKRDHGFLWSGCQSGMDNTPRGRGDYTGVLWLDALSQQALSALYISRIAGIIGESTIHNKYMEHYNRLKATVNKYYWNEKDGIYYDCSVTPDGGHVKVKTPAAYWPMLAEICDKSQAERLVENLLNPEIFGGSVPCPSVSRDDKDYDSRGNYWCGGVWIPVAYMVIKALEKYGFYEIAEDVSYKLIRYMHKTYTEYEPHTIWEAYNPEKPIPATGKGNGYYVRPNFCGWSALGPISLFIENILGFHTVDGIKKQVIWRKRRKGRYGIRGLKFGGVEADIIGDNGIIEVKASKEFSLIVNDKKFLIKPWVQQISVSGHVLARLHRQPPDFLQ